MKQFCFLGKQSEDSQAIPLPSVDPDGQAHTGAFGVAGGGRESSWSCPLALP